MSNQPAGVIDVYNVKDFGAKGDGVTDDTLSIQNALNECFDRFLTEHLGGGIFFPSGVYLISQTLLIPPHTQIFGMSGGFSQAGIFSLPPEPPFCKRQPTIIRLSASSYCNMIVPRVYEDQLGLEHHFFPYESCIIQNISFDGNKSENQSEADYAGVRLPDITSNDNGRSNLLIENVLIMNVNGYGFYGGSSQNEYQLKNVFSLMNKKDGFVFKGMDISLTRIGAGQNEEIGMRFDGSGAYRCVELDAWGNQKGFIIENCQDGYFYKLQADHNVEEGLWMRNCGDITVVGGVFKWNSKVRDSNIFSKQFSNIKLNGNDSNYGAYCISFIGCKIGENHSSGNEPVTVKYGIEDISGITRPNQIIGCSFKTNDFDLGNVNDNILKNYVIADCLAWGDFGHEEFWKIRIESGDCTLQVFDRVLEIMPSNPNESNVYSTLLIPNSTISNFKRGRQYLIIRKKNPAQPTLKLRVQCIGNGLINNQNFYEFSNESDSPPLLSVYLTFLGSENYIDYWEAK